MKKIFLFLLIAFLFTSVSAQIKMGYKAGSNFSNIKISNNNYSVLPSFNTGIFFSFYFSGKYFLDAELLYSVKGYRSIQIPVGTIRNRLNYLSLPLLSGWKAAKKFYFVVGPEISYLTKAVMIDQSGKSDIADYYQKVDIGIDAGAEFDLTKKIKLELTYDYGLSKVLKQYYVGGPRHFTTGYNRVIQFDIAYIF